MDIRIHNSKCHPYALIDKLEKRQIVEDSLMELPQKSSSSNFVGWFKAPTDKFEEKPNRILFPIICVCIYNLHKDMKTGKLQLL